MFKSLPLLFFSATNAIALWLRIETAVIVSKLLLVPTLIIYLLVRVDQKPEPHILVFLLALVACFIGDAILLSAQASPNDGIIPFAAAHMLFIVAFGTQRKWPSPFVVPVYAATGFALLAIASPAIMVYGVVLVLMATLASGFGLYGFLGGLCFICADVLLLWVTAHPDRLGHIVEMQLYIVALLGLTKGLLRQRKRNLMHSSDDEEAIEADMKMLDQCLDPSHREADRLAMWNAHIGAPVSVIRRQKPVAIAPPPEPQPTASPLSFSVLPSEFLTWLRNTPDEAVMLERPSLSGISFQQMETVQTLNTYLWRKQGRPYDPDVFRQDMKIHGCLEEPLIIEHQTLKFRQFVGHNFCVVLALRDDILLHYWVVKS